MLRAQIQIRTRAAPPWQLQASVTILIVNGGVYV
jgi:hypothetical protein